MKPSALVHAEQTGATVGELLCHCKPDATVTVAAFRQAVAESPSEDFYDLCSRLDVGQRCTACLLDAEQIYCADTGTDVRRPARTAVDTAAASAARLGLKARLYRLVDAIMPPMATPRHELAPVIGGRGLTTELIVSNVVPLGFPPAATIHLTGEVRDAQGTRRSKWRRRVSPGMTAVFPLSEALTAASAPTLAHGLAKITLVLSGAPHFGFARPHFVVRSPNATTAVHTQHRNTQDIYFTVAQTGDDCVTMVSHINLSARPNHVAMTVRSRSRPDVSLKVERTVPGGGCDVFTVPTLCDRGAKIHDLYTVHATASRAIRRNVLIADAALTRLSWDHM